MYITRAALITETMPPLFHKLEEIKVMMHDLMSPDTNVLPLHPKLQGNADVLKESLLNVHYTS